MNNTIVRDAAVRVVDNLSTLNTKTNVLESRMNTFTALPEGATTNDAALEDIKVGYDGTVYASPGEAVRSQVGQLSSEIKENVNDIDDLNNAVFEFDNEYTNISYDENLIIDGYIYVNQWRVENSAYNVLIYPITSGKLYYLAVPFTYGNAKTFLLLKNLDNDGSGKIIDENESTDTNRTVILKDVDTTDYNYIACCVPKGRNEAVIVNETNKVKVSNVRKRLYVGSSREITKFSEGVIKAMEIGNCDLYVDAGTYDLLSEIGVDLMANDPRYQHGLRVDNGVRIFFSSGAKVTCNYTGDNESINTYFCILYTKNGDFELHNADFECSNVRYCVHDESDGIGSYTHLFYNCKMKLDNTNNKNNQSRQCIGGGLGEYVTIIVDGGYYESVDCVNGEITYHNPMSGKGNQFKNKVVIRNVYFKNATCHVTPLGDSTKLTEFYASGCSCKTYLPYVNDGPEAINHNVIGFIWNNELRQ